MSEIELSNLSNDELREWLKKSNKNFSVKSFFERSGPDANAGAIVVITSNQIVATVTEGDGVGLHEEMLKRVIQAIYDLPPLPSSRIFRTNITELYERHMAEVIVIQMWVYKMKSDGIQVKFPKFITSGQLDMLRFCQTRYGTEIDELVDLYLEKKQDLLMRCNASEDKKADKAEKVNRFSDIIEYAKDILKLRKTSQYSEYLIGDTEKTSLEFIREGLKGVTISECTNIGCGRVALKHSEKTIT